jgi:hypothetical protein
MWGAARLRGDASARTEMDMWDGIAASTRAIWTGLEPCSRACVAVWSFHWHQDRLIPTDASPALLF